MSKKRKVEFLFFAILFVFSWWLMWKTFRINQLGNLEIATKVWSDFAATIPLIRSFSFGHNFPPQYPLFAGPPIRYHFIFFSAVGLLEKMGVKLDWALNSLSILSFFALLLAIYFLSKELFKKRSVSVLSCIFFLFNGSLSFLEFFRKNPISSHTLSDIVQNTSFPSFAPYDGSNLVSAFWSLNIYTNQRHLAFAYAFFLMFILIVYKALKKKGGLSLNKSLILGILAGFFPFLHLSVFVMIEISLFILFVISPNIRKGLFISALISLIIALPQIIYMGVSVTNTDFFRPFYLVSNPTFLSLIKYWFYNLGFAIILSPIGFLLAKRRQRKIFLPFLSFFLIGNLFRLSPEMAANHKFFNLFLIGANMFAAYSIYRLWKYKTVGKIIAIFYVFVMTFSGIIDIFPIKNDVYSEIKDGKNNEVEQFIVDNTPKDSVFVNASYIYDPASLAGRRVLLGWPYFSWSAGYDTDERFNLLKNILESSDLEYSCSLLKNAGVNYIEIQNPTPIEGIEINYNFFKEHFNKIFSSSENNIYIYDAKTSCVKFDDILPALKSGVSLQKRMTYQRSIHPRLNRSVLECCYKSI